ncbi:hypothetical protein SUGI_0496820 [Cryptomeria japonica]|uniref:kinesin-like protein KIN-10C n=1 Tax=Cryptomeria japonica TaxID=3369 RepID=UPI002408C97E|nr:kinesin-like protein KIN-10C [Cryptomeria japonica]GLJ25916.1 hypothetical protein SUGI_0496820 [Cryptomeria japonica]
MSATEVIQRITPPSPAHCLRRADDGQLKVRVVARIRPLLPKEIKAGKGKPKSCLTVKKPNGDSEMEHVLHIEEDETNSKASYKLDFCYDQEDGVAQIFTREVEGLLAGLFRGCNATVFAYGASGSGKTHIMQGDKKATGLMSRAISSLLSKVNNSESRVDISYYEVYMDKCYDLLGPKTKSQVPISLFEDSEGHVQLLGLQKLRVSSVQEFEQILSYGCLGRKMGHTALNHVSSRSHGVLVIWVTCGNVVGKLNLIDLAGNEDNRRSKNEGISLKESSKINQSLFALSNVIHALNANEKRVPYRDSKLTRILQDSLGGTSRTLMIACLNPVSFSEALHTLSLAGRCTQMVNHDVKAKVDCKLIKPKQSLNAKGISCSEVEGPKSDGNYKLRNCSSVLNTPHPTSKGKSRLEVEGPKSDGNYKSSHLTSVFNISHSISKGKSCVEVEGSKIDGNYKSSHSSSGFNTSHPTAKGKSYLVEEPKSDDNYKSSCPISVFYPSHPTPKGKSCPEVEGPKSGVNYKLNHPHSVFNTSHPTPKYRRDYDWKIFVASYNVDHLYKMMFKNSFEESQLVCSTS